MFLLSHKIIAFSKEATPIQHLSVKVALAQKWRIIFADHFPFEWSAIQLILSTFNNYYGQDHVTIIIHGSTLTTPHDASDIDILIITSGRDLHSDTPALFSLFNELLGYDLCSQHITAHFINLIFEHPTAKPLNVTIKSRVSDLQNPLPRSFSVLDSVGYCPAVSDDGLGAVYDKDPLAYPQYRLDARCKMICNALHGRQVLFIPNKANRFSLLHAIVTYLKMNKKLILTISTLSLLAKSFLELSLPLQLDYAQNQLPKFAGKMQDPSQFYRCLIVTIFKAWQRSIYAHPMLSVLRQHNVQMETYFKLFLGVPTRYISGLAEVMVSRPPKSTHTKKKPKSPKPKDHRASIAANNTHSLPAPTPTAPTVPVTPPRSELPWIPQTPTGSPPMWGHKSNVARELFG